MVLSLPVIKKMILNALNLMVIFGVYLRFSGILKLPDDWYSNYNEVVSFRYELASQRSLPQGEREIFYFKFLEAGGKLEINALSSKG